MKNNFRVFGCDFFPMRTDTALHDTDKTAFQLGCEAYYTFGEFHPNYISMSLGLNLEGQMLFEEKVKMGDVRSEKIVRDFLAGWVESEFAKNYYYTSKANLSKVLRMLELGTNVALPGDVITEESKEIPVVFSYDDKRVHYKLGEIADKLRIQPNGIFYTDQDFSHSITMLANSHTQTVLIFQFIDGLVEKLVDLVEKQMWDSYRDEMRARIRQVVRSNQEPPISATHSQRKNLYLP